MKNKKKIILSYLIILFLCNIALANEEINYSSNSLKVFENGKFMINQNHKIVKSKKNPLKLFKRVLILKF